MTRSDLIMFAAIIPIGLALFLTAGALGWSQPLTSGMAAVALAVVLFLRLVLDPTPPLSGREERSAGKGRRGHRRTT